MASAPRQHGVGLIQGISTARVKFPTRTKNVHKVPTERAKERRLGGHLSEFSSNHENFPVACVALPCHCPVVENVTVFVSSLFNKPKMPIGVGKTRGFGAALARWISRTIAVMEPLYIDPLVDFSEDPCAAARRWRGGRGRGGGAVFFASLWEATEATGRWDGRPLSQRPPPPP